MALRWYRIPDPKNPDHTLILPRVTTVLDVTMPLDRREKLVRSQMDDPIGAHLRKIQGASRGVIFDNWVKSCCVSRRILACPTDQKKLCDRFRPYLHGLVRWPPHYTDEVIWHDSGFAGTLDLVSHHEAAQDLVVYELKTSAYRPWPAAVAEAELQAAAYYLGWNQRHPDNLVHGICTIHVTPYEMLENYHHDQSSRFREILAQWGLRLRQFGSRYSQTQVDHYV